MKNNYDFTLELTGDAFITDSDGNTLGRAYATFSPALPGRASQANVEFFRSNIAGNSFKAATGIVFNAKFCKSITDNRFIREDLCRAITATGKIK